MKVILIRHGESEKNVQNICNADSSAELPLTQKGRAQAEAAADAIKPHNVELILSSELPRARETAEIIGQRVGIKVSIDPRLNELNNGVFEGKKESNFHQFLDNDYENRLTKIPENGETWDELTERIKECILAQKKPTLFVTHGHPMEAALRIIDSIPLNERVEIPGNCEIAVREC